MNKQELINYINDYLKITEFTDESKNGLQVDNTKDEIKKIAYAVDATSYIFDKAIKENVDLILVHHGMFWGFEQVLVGVHFERSKKLIENNIALAGYHLPLDAHEEVGNNAGLVQEFVKTFDIKEYDIEDFANYRGNNIGFGIKFHKHIYIENIVKEYCKKAKLEEKLYNFGDKKAISSVAFCSGGALEPNVVKEAKDKNYDLFITGEGAHFQISYAKDLGQTILLGGHYETEIFGPRLLAKHLEEKFGLEIVELDEKY